MKPNKSLTVMILASAIGAFLFAGPVKQETAKALFERAVYLEETRGELLEAVKVYNSILERFPQDQEIAAKALYRIGMCYERLGNQGAQIAYRRIIDEYPGRKEEVALARARLAELIKAADTASRKPVFRKIRIPANPGNGILSPDGKRFAFVSDGSVWVVPIPGNVQSDLAGEAVRLTEPIGAWNSGNTMAWSADGRWIAFNVRDNKEPGVATYVVSSEGGEPKKIPVTAYRISPNNLFRLSLSPDGQRLAFSSMDIETLGTIRTYKDAANPDPHLLYTIPLSSSAGERARRLTSNWACEPAFSPDGTRIAYAQRIESEGGRFKQDLWVVNEDGGNPVRLTDASSQFLGPVWSPDGGMIAFIHHPGSTNDSTEIWIVPAPLNAQGPGDPVKIEMPNSADYNMIAGWSSDNKIGLLMENPFHQAVYTVSAEGGKATQITPEDQGEGYPCYPKWSSDGEKVFLRWGRGDIVSVPAQGGELTIVHDRANTKVLTGIPGGGGGISPDGRTIVFMGAKTGTQPLKVNIWTESVAGGEPRQITESPTQDRYPCWSPDGKSVAFLREWMEPGGDYVFNILVTSLDGGDTRQITSESDRVGYASIDWSPDGNWIAYYSKDNTINLKPVQGGTPRVLLNVERFHSHSDLSWSPDGSELAYTLEGRLMVVSLKSGETREVQTGVLGKGAQNFHIDWSPDGSRFVFSAGFGGESELWLMEDFLHLIKR